jgi:hypothetical protein
VQVRALEGLRIKVARMEAAVAAEQAQRQGAEAQLGAMRAAKAQVRVALVILHGVWVPLWVYIHVVTRTYTSYMYAYTCIPSGA